MLEWNNVFCQFFYKCFLYVASMNGRLTFNLEATWKRHPRLWQLNVRDILSWAAIRTARCLERANVIGCMGGAWTCDVWSLHVQRRFGIPAVSISNPPIWSMWSLQHRYHLFRMKKTKKLNWLINLYCELCNWPTVISDNITELFNLERLIQNWVFYEISNVYGSSID